MPPAGPRHPGGGHLSFSVRPGLWEARALFTICLCDCCVARPGFLPVSTLAGATSPRSLCSPLPPPPPATPCSSLALLSSDLAATCHSVANRGTWLLSFFFSGGMRKNYQGF